MRATGRPDGNTPPNPELTSRSPLLTSELIARYGSSNSPELPEPTAIERRLLRVICTGMACSGSVTRMIVEAEPGHAHEIGLAGGAAAGVRVCAVVRPAR